MTDLYNSIKNITELSDKNNVPSAIIQDLLTIFLEVCIIRNKESYFRQVIFFILIAPRHFLAKTSLAVSLRTITWKRLSKS